MNSLTEARAFVAGALAGIGVPVHDQPPSPIGPPCVVLFPGTPWLAPRGHVTFDLVCYANTTAGTPNALDRLETIVHAARDALYAAALSAGDVDPPRTDPLTGALSCSMPVTLRVSCH